MARSDELEREIDDLYVQPPEGFTRARDALAKRLKAEGDDDDARRVRALRKPVRSAWAVNRLVREDRSAVEELLAVGGRLRVAQRRALSGTAADELRERSEERRRLIGELTGRAADLLGGDPAPGVLEEVAAALDAASAEESSAQVVLEGRLARPLPRPSGFGGIFGGAPLKAVAGGGRATEAEPQRADERAAERERRVAERERERAVRAAEATERRTRQRVERLRVEIAQLQERLAERRQELRAAEAEARGAALELRRLRR